MKYYSARMESAMNWIEEELRKEYEQNDGTSNYALKLKKMWFECDEAVQWLEKAEKELQNTAKKISHEIWEVKEEKGQNDLD